MAAKPESVSFDATVAATGNNTGIVVPDEVIKRLAAGRRPPVLVNLNGYEYRNTIGVMNGKHLISVSAAVSTSWAVRTVTMIRPVSEKRRPDGAPDGPLIRAPFPPSMHSRTPIAASPSCGYETQSGKSAKSP